MPKELPTIEKLKLKDLVIDTLYSGRTEKEINDNAKDKARELKAAGGWSPSMPGQYFERDGKKFLLAGFSRVKGCEINGDKEGYFVKSNGDEIDHLLACETSNSVRPLSKVARGERYLKLLNGTVADDFAGAIAEKPEDWKLPPMTREEIAARIGTTAEWVRQCVAAAEAPEEIRELLETERIAASVFEGATAIANKHYDGSDPKRIAICKRALRYAAEQGKEKATKQHFDAIKDEFIPAKKLKADGGESGDSAPATEKPYKYSDASNDSGEVEPLTPVESTQPELIAPEVLTGGTKKNKKAIEALATFFTDDDALNKIDVTMTLAPDEAERLAEKVLEIVNAAQTVF